MAFDLVFSPNEHAFTLVDHFNHWMIDHRFLRGHWQGLGNIAPFAGMKTVRDDSLRLVARSRQ
jgi:hypothetical protein